MKTLRIKGRWCVVSDGKVVAKGNTQKEADAKRQQLEDDAADQDAEYISWRKRNGN